MATPKQSTGSTIIRFYDPDIQAKDALGRTQEQILAWADSKLENSHNYIQMLFPLPEGSPFNFAAPVIDLETMEAFRARSELRQRLRKSFERMLTFYGFTASTDPEAGSEDKKDMEVKIAKKQEQTSVESVPETIKVVAQPAAGSMKSSDDSSKCDTNSTATNTSAAGVEAPEEESASQASLSIYQVVRGSNWRKASRNWCVRFDHNHLRITRILRCLRVLGLQIECNAFFAALERVYNDPAITISNRTMEFWSRAVQRPLYLAPDDDRIGWLRTWETEQQATE